MADIRNVRMGDVTRTGDVSGVKGCQIMPTRGSVEHDRNRPFDGAHATAAGTDPEPPTQPLKRERIHTRGVRLTAGDKRSAFED